MHKIKMADTAGTGNWKGGWKRVQNQPATHHPQRITPNASPPTWNVIDSYPVIEKARKPAFVPYVCVFSRFPQKNASKSRYHLFVDDEENSKTSMKELEELLLINSSVIDVC